MSLSENSRRLSDIITAELDYSEDKKEIVAYGIESIVLAILGFVAVLLVAFPLKVLLPAASAVAFGGALRKVSGGAHLNTPLKCLVFGAVVYSLLGVIAKQIVKFDLYSAGLSLLILAICLGIVALLAPVDCEAKPIHSPTLRKKLKIVSSGFVVLACAVVLLSNNTLLNTGAVLGIVYQTMTLLPVFNKKKKEVSL